MTKVVVPNNTQSAGAVPDDGPCFYCREMTNHFAGDPGEWPLQFCQPDGTGITRFHHTRCVVDRLRGCDVQSDDDPPMKWLIERLRGLAVELLADPKTAWIGERDPKQHICWTAADRLAALSSPKERQSAPYSDGVLSPMPDWQLEQMRQWCRDPRSEDEFGYDCARYLLVEVDRLRAEQAKEGQSEPVAWRWRPTNSPFRTLTWTLSERHPREFNRWDIEYEPLYAALSEPKADATAGRDEIIEQCARIADPWPGFDVGQKMTEPDQSVIEVRNKIAAAIRALAMPSANRGGAA